MSASRAGGLPEVTTVEPRDTSARPRLLDLFCCEGGASMGYARAGFDVVGVDLFKDYSQRRYPYPSMAVDALVALDELIADPGAFGAHFDAIHASPPCQHASAGTRAIDRSDYPRLIEPVRERLDTIGLPYVIENVEGSALREPLTLCGTMFGLTAIDTDGTPLELWRHRRFESQYMLVAPRNCRHGAYSEQVAGCYGGARSDKDEARNERHGGYVPKSRNVLSDLMGISWMTKRGMYQALPPAYTAWIGWQLIRVIDEKKQEMADA